MKKQKSVKMWGVIEQTDGKPRLIVRTLLGAKSWACIGEKVRPVTVSWEE